MPGLHPFASLWRCERGVAALEMSLCMPVLLLLVLGGYEMSRYMLIQQKIEKIAFSTADVIAQTDPDEQADISQIFAATEQIMKPFPFGENGAVIVTSVSRDEGADAQTVGWQCRSQGGLAEPSAVGAVGEDGILPNNMVLEEDDDVVVVEVFYVFTPLFRTVFTEPYVLHREALFRPRLGSLTSAGGC